MTRTLKWRCEPRLLRWVIAVVLVIAWSRSSQASAAEEPAVRIMAASSLADVVGEAATRFAQTRGAPRPVVALSGTSKLVRQIEAGARADVVLTADDSWMDILQERGLIDGTSRRVIARNVLVVAVPKARRAPSDPRGLLDADVRTIAVARPEVPAGARAREALRTAGLLGELAPRFVNAGNVRSALALVDRGEVDAAIVYLTDALVADGARVAFRFAVRDHAEIRYSVALTNTAARSEAAAAFVAFVAGPPGQELLTERGFSTDGQGTVVATAKGPWVGDVSGAEGTTPAVLRTLWVGVMSLVLSVVPAVLLGWLLARREFRGKTLLSTVLMTPLVLPPVVVGFLLLELFGRSGPLAGLGLDIAFSRWGAVVAAAVVGFPLLVLLSRTAIAAVDPRYEQIAQTLGQRPIGAFWRVTLPLSLPGLVAGAVVGFARALGEFGATAVLAGDIPGETRTLALALFALYEQPGAEDAAHRLVWISIGLCAAALVAYEALNRVQRRRLAQ